MILFSKENENRQKIIFIIFKYKIIINKYLYILLNFNLSIIIYYIQSFVFILNAKNIFQTQWSSISSLAFF